MPQGLGRGFVPNWLHGYYNDLSAKVNWVGPVDQDGIPLDIDQATQPHYFITPIIQKALGHWDMALLNGAERQVHQQQFLSLCEWAVANQDACGGWPIWFLIDQPGFRSPYSAMAQGEAASALVRAYELTHDERYYTSARRSIELMLTPVGEGGTARCTGDGGLVLEEFVQNPPNTILNGWIFALYGLYDFLLMEEEWALRQALDNTVQTLIALLPGYNAGFWSWYDTRHTICTPFYHALHIAQLRALAKTFPQHATAIKATLHQFEVQNESRLNQLRAIQLKIFQKLVHPPLVVQR